MIINEDLRIGAILNQMVGEHDHNELNFLRLLQKLDNESTRRLRISEYMMLQGELYLRLSEGEELETSVNRYLEELVRLGEQHLHIQREFIAEREGYIDDNDQIQSFNTPGMRESYMRGIELQFMAELRLYYNFRPTQEENYAARAQELKELIAKENQIAYELLQQKTPIYSDFHDFLYNYEKRRFTIINTKTFSSDVFLQACASGNIEQITVSINKARSDQSFRDWASNSSLTLFKTKEAEEKGQQDIYYGLHLAVRYSRLNAAAHLLANGYPVNQATGLAQATALHIACKMGDVQMVRLLLDDPHIIVDQPGPEDRTALHYAAYNGHASIVKLLIQRGANPFARDKEGHTTFHDALRREPIPWIQIRNKTVVHEFSSEVDQILAQQEQVAAILLDWAQRNDKLIELLSTCDNIKHSLFDEILYSVQSTLLQQIVTVQPDFCAAAKDFQKVALENLRNQAQAISEHRELQKEMTRLKSLVMKHLVDPDMSIEDAMAEVPGIQSLRKAIDEQQERIGRLHGEYKLPKNPPQLSDKASPH